MKVALSLIFMVFFAAAAATIAGSRAPVTARSLPSPTPSPTVESFESVQEFLITSAATDFTEHQPPYPRKFRNVKIGHVGDTTKSGAWRMCGEFMATGGEDADEWVGFVTVKTSGYEQYIGSGSNFCTHPNIVWDTAGDLAPLLKEKLDSLKKGK